MATIAMLCNLLGVLCKSCLLPYLLSTVLRVTF